MRGGPTNSNPSNGRGTTFRSLISESNPGEKKTRTFADGQKDGTIVATFRNIRWESRPRGRETSPVSLASLGVNPCLAS